MDEPGLAVTSFGLTGTVLGAELQNGGANAITLGYNGQPAWDLSNYGYVCGAGGSNACNPLSTVNWHTGAPPGRWPSRRGTTRLSRPRSRQYSAARAAP